MPPLTHRPGASFLRRALILPVLLACVAALSAAPRERRPPEPPATSAERIGRLLPLHRPIEDARIPSFTEEGVQDSVLEARRLTRVGEEELLIENLRLTRFEESGRSDLRMQAPYASYRLARELLSSPYPATITKDDYFAARGSGLVLDYANQFACLLGPVTMVVDDTLRPRPAKPGEEAPAPEDSASPASPRQPSPELLARTGHARSPALLGVAVTRPAVLGPAEEERVLAEGHRALAEARLQDARIRMLLTPSAEDDLARRRLEAALAAVAAVAGQTTLPVQAEPDPSEPKPAADAERSAPRRARPAAPADDGGVLSPPPRKAAPAEEHQLITIRSSGHTYLDLKEFVVIYEGDVILEHPEFRLTCERLVVYRGEGDSEIKKAVATGPMVVIRRQNPEGILEEARCRQAVYENDEMILLDWPQIQRARLLTRATSPRTRLIIPRQGKSYFDGPSQMTAAEEKPAAQEPPR